MVKFKTILITSFLLLFFSKDVRALSRHSKMAAKKLQSELDKTEQDCFKFIPDKQKGENSLIEYDPTLTLEKYLHHYFAPWNDPYAIISPVEIKDFLDYVIKKIQKTPGLGINNKPFSKDLINELINNIELINFPNFEQKGITLHNTYLRVLPSESPNFTNNNSEGSGYPFDNFQISCISAFQPLYIIHITKNKDWHLVLTSQHVLGWIKAKDIAFVDDEFISKWQHQIYITPLVENIPLVTRDHKKFMTTTRIGQILPLMKENDDNYEILSAFVDNKNIAKIETSILKKVHASRMPLLLSANNIARIANAFLGKPYGWGGICGFRDCSELLRDIFSPFGLFLPRNSRWQSDSGTIINLNKLKFKEKKKIIVEKGIPFLSLLYTPGHIMLYIGEKNKNPYIYHTIWALKTRRAFREPGRAVIGKTLIMPLDTGAKFCQIKASLLKRVTALTLLSDNFNNPEIFEGQIQSDIILDNELKRQEEIRQKIEVNFASNKNILKLYSAYHNYISDIYLDNEKIFFKMTNGEKILWNEDIDTEFESKLLNPSLQDIFYQKYKLNYPIKPPKKDNDPGRFRNDQFLKSVYGQNINEVHNNLVKIRWMPETLKDNPTYIYFNKQAGAAAALLKVIHELDKLPEKLKKYVTTLAGTYKWRYIAGTNRMSPHSYGIAIDINLEYSHYWRWEEDLKSKKAFKYKNQIPEEIIKIFENNGFIWGGRWYHYDTMHFEYRPELLEKS